MKVDFGLKINHLEIFPIDIIFCYGNTDSLLNYTNTNNFKNDLDNCFNYSESEQRELKDAIVEAINNFKESLGFATIVSDNIILMYVNYLPTSVEKTSYIIHELSHCTSFIFDIIGAKHKDSTDEFYSYILGYLYKLFMKAFEDGKYI